MKLIECVRCLDNESRHLLHAVIYRDRDKPFRCYIYQQQSSADKDGIAFGILLSLNLRISTFHKSRFS